MKLESSISDKISALGFIAAFFVVMIHTPQPVPASPAEPEWWLYHMTAGTLGRLAVPFYFVVAGFFFARHAGESGWWRREAAKRVKSLLVPFVIWLLAWNVLAGGLAVFSNWRSGADLLRGLPRGCAALSYLGLHPLSYPFNIPLWFARSLLLYVAAGEILIRLLRRWGLAFPAVVLLASVLERAQVGPEWLRLFADRFVSLHGLFYFLVGASVATGLAKQKLARGPLVAAVGVAGVAALFLSQWMLARGVPLARAVHELALPPALLLAWRVMPETRWPRALTSLTFAIYVLHVFAVRVLDVAMYGRPGCAILVLKYACVCVATLAAAAAFRRVAPKAYSLAFGGR